MKIRVATVYADDGGNGHIEWNPEFEKEDGLFRADVLRDAAWDFEQAYQEARSKIWIVVRRTHGADVPDGGNDSGPKEG